MKSSELFQEIKENLLKYPPHEPKKSDNYKDNLISDYDFNIYNEIIEKEILEIDEKINDDKIDDFKKRIDYNLKKWDVNQKDFIEFIKYISLYLFFIAKKPLHPVGTPFESDIKGVFEENGVYYCNSKKRYIKEDNSHCLYCVAKKS